MTVRFLTLLSAGCLVLAGCENAPAGNSGAPASGAASGSGTSTAQVASDIAIGAAQACVRGNRNACRFYFDLRNIANLLNRVKPPLAELGPRLPGPICPQALSCPPLLDFDDRTIGQLDELLGDPSPQPSINRDPTPTPILPALSLDLLPAQDQLKAAVEHRDLIRDHLASMDQQIASLEQFANTP